MLLRNKKRIKIEEIKKSLPRYYNVITDILTIICNIGTSEAESDSAKRGLRNKLKSGNSGPNYSPECNRRRSQIEFIEVFLSSSCNLYFATRRLNLFVFSL